MHRTSTLLISASLFAFATPVFAQEAAPATDASAATQVADDETGSVEVVVTARKREEQLKDVPIAATAVTGDTIEKRGLTSVKEVAALTPSLNINSDGAGRAFVSIRGVGTTLIDTIQPGVGIFVDGIYQPNTSYLNNPLTDVERVEVLRGPQGTLYGKNTLGGAISVITRQPTNQFEGKVIGSFAGPDDAWTAGASVSGPIIADKLQARISFTHQQQDGFIRNTLINEDQNPLNTDALSGTIVARPAGDVKLTINGYYTWLKGGSVPYIFVDGPTDYRDEISVNANNYQYFKYRGLNAKLQAPLGDTTDVTLIGSYDRRGVTTDNADPDFTPFDILRQDATDDLKTSAAELRFDSKWSDKFSTLVGFYYSHETRVKNGLIVARANVPPFGDITQVVASNDDRKGDAYAAFANAFFKPSPDLEIALGLRLDHEKRKSNGGTGEALLFGSFEVDEVDRPDLVPNDELTIKSTKLLPKATVTKFWNDQLMSYVSVAKGYRGGGFNGPDVPAAIRTFKGDSAWTYEVGAKYSSLDRRVSLAGALFYNDYKDYIGLNTILGLDVGFTTIDLNSGDVKSYGVELEGVFRATPEWTLSGGGSLMHARLSNTDIYTETTGRTLASDRLSFQPDWNFNLNSNYVVPVGNGSLDFYAGLVGKGSRIPASIRQEIDEPGFQGSHPPLRPLKAYVLANTSLTYKIGDVEITGFVNNVFNTKYFESYIERTTLILAGLPNSDVGIIGDKRRYGIRTRVRF
ncbi:TonB-dependent receptor [Sphingomonas rhizophila]|uniref:TonB-dependent receptor n=1 Tax=Sphingomonas rhizophila TaxID=2071607 RepID=A0A7G9SBQ6_9SPHN|nr:TonB-dependent receptor [Sphingomonas rhizophila]QNN65281.1 TonB-dependent receptor [Sphingomonas rhizophila]